jgi:two-component system phosphate regulon sensor histidine kinase PhoR
MGFWIAAACVLALACWGFSYYWLRPLRELRDSLRAVARSEGRFPATTSRLRIFKSLTSDLGLIYDQLQQQRRQLEDEGFSLRAILGSMVEGIMIVDRGLRIRLANDALYSMFDLTQSPINRMVLEVFRDHRVTSAMQRVLNESRSVNLEFQTDAIASAGQPEKFFRVTLSPLLPAGGVQPAGVLAVFNDVTEIRSLEAVRRDFVANVSHEFRTPLAIITGYVETLLDGALDDREMAVRSLQVIQRHGKRLNLLIDDLLTISRLEHRSVQLRVRQTNLRELAARVVEQLESEISAAGATVAIEFQAAAEEIEVDPPRIEQVILNLIANAVRYGRREGGVITISGKRRDGEVELIVSDNGPGIPYEDQPHIFERFYRVRKDRARDAGGTGLGLSIVKNVALIHGGHVSVRSTPGNGAAFLVVLPVEQPKR